ncbi:MAG: dTDP-4-dehydrorhamnose reductase [Azospirillum brasilense]|nr:MAG: dTDP-4-dehydrorhamnose reductase [Azospirillum brasilense]
MSQPVLILGANGQVGHRLAERFAGDVQALERTQCDLETLTFPQAQALLQQHQPCMLINAAAYTAVDAAEGERTRAEAVNATAPGLLAQAAAAMNIPFVHFSTDYVFDGARGPYGEDASPNPLSVYGASKWYGEQTVRAAGGRAYIFRLQWVYDTRGSNFLCTMQRLLRERETLRVVADQLGAPTPAREVARAIHTLAPAMQSGQLAPGTYHLTCGGFTSWHGFACAIAAQQKSAARVLPIPSHEYAMRAPRPLDARLDCRTLAAHGMVLPHWRQAFDALMEE